MRVLFNGLSMMGRTTGVGQYGLRLVGAMDELAESLGIEKVGVFDGATVTSAKEFLVRTRGDSEASRPASWKPFVRRFLPGARALRDAWRRRKLADSARNGRWSILHETNFISPDIGLPVVATVHDMGYVRYPQFMPKDRLRWLRRSMGATLANSRAVLADSEFTRREILELAPEARPDRTHAVPLGVDAAYFDHPRHAARARETRAKYGLPERFLLYLGTLEPRKNLQGLAQGYDLLPRTLQRQFPLVLAGMSGWREEFFRGPLGNLLDAGLAREIGYVPREEVAALMKAASVFCFPSLYEGFGLPPLEAAACGTPVLCADTASLPEVMGDAAVYVNPFSAADIALGLRRILEDEEQRESLSVLGRRRAAAFTWEQCARRTVEAYRAA